MRILCVGAGGVGSAFCAIAARRDFFDHVVVCDYDEARAKEAATAVNDARFSAAQVNASSPDAVAELVRAHQITHVFNAVDPRFVMPIFDGALAGGAGPGRFFPGTWDGSAEFTGWSGLAGQFGVGQQPGRR